jgi:hypothetical protein
MAALARIYALVYDFRRACNAPEVAINNNVRVYLDATS